MRSWERELFGGAYDDAKGFDRCKYGALQLGRRSEDSKGQMDCQWSSPEMMRSIYDPIAPPCQDSSVVLF